MDERDDRSSVRPFGSRYENERVRKRTLARRRYPIPTLSKVESDRRDSLRMAQHNLLDISESDSEHTNTSDPTWTSSRGSREIQSKIPTRRRTRPITLTENEFRVSCVDNEETNVRDKYTMFDEGGQLSPRLRTRNHRISRLSRCFKSRMTVKKPRERNPYSFDVIVAMLVFRLMSRSQRCLEYNEPEIPIDEFEMKIVKVLICHVLRWMKDQKLIKKQQTKHHFRPPSCDDSQDTSSVQTSSSIDYIPPKYLQNFLSLLEEATDLRPAYIHAHNRTIIHNDDDGMSIEQNNLCFIEMEIGMELSEIDAEHKAKLSAEKLKEQIPTDLQYMDHATATDAFYNAVVAMAGDDLLSDEEDESSSEGTEASFDVENARATVLQLVNQIQSQLPQQASNEATQALPQVQRKIMNDLVYLSQNSEPKKTYEISIDLQASVSTIGSYDCLDDEGSLVGNERYGSVSNIDPVESQPSDEINTVEVPLKSQEINQGINAGDAQDNSRRNQKTIWKNLVGRQQNSDRTSPYLQFMKPSDEWSVGTEHSDVESKYLRFEYIRKSHENNNSIEVILKDNFELSTTNNMLAGATSHIDERIALITEESSEPGKIVTNSKKSAMINQDTKTTDVRGKENKVHINQIKKGNTEIPFDESVGKTKTYLEGVTWSLSTTTDDALFETERKEPEVSEKRSSIANNYVSRPKLLGRKSAIANYYDSRPKLSENNHCENFERDYSMVRRRTVDVSMCSSPTTSDYWNTLITYSFTPAFDESIASAPFYVVPTTSSEGISEAIVKNMNTSTDTVCESIVKDPSVEDPSGRYCHSIADYSGHTSSVCTDEKYPQKIQVFSSESLGLMNDTSVKVEEHDPFIATRKIPQVFSETDVNLEFLEMPSDCFEQPIQSLEMPSDCFEQPIQSLEMPSDCFEQPIQSNLDGYAETVYFDTEEFFSTHRRLV